MYTTSNGKLFLDQSAPSYISNGLDYRGNSSLLESNNTASIIGSRKPTEKGAYAAEQLTRYLTVKNYTIISGMALGIDTIAHNTSLELGGNTIAVIGTPIDKIYPKENKLLAQRIIESGLMLSQFPEGTAIRPSNFPQRNKTMAFLSNATIVCDASHKSGTKHQVKEALKLQKKVYFMEHLLSSNIPWINQAIENGAQIIKTNAINSLDL